MNAGERLDDNGHSAKVTGLEGSVLARRALAIVLVADNHPGDAGRLVLPVSLHTRQLSLL